MFHDTWPLALSVACAGLLMPLAINVRAVGRDLPKGIQKLHQASTSRLGGVIVVAAYVAVLGVAMKVGHLALAAALPLALAALPVVAAGLTEDLTGKVRPRYRMLAAVASAVLASAFAGGVIPRLDVPLLDPLLKHAWILLPLTWFMVAGACNAMNLVDGTNGLAGGTALIMFGGIAAAAAWSADPATLAEALVMIGVLVGFLAWNYPRGRVFLGDAGAYFVGFIYAELAIRLIARNPEISAWYVVMLAAYPIVDTLFAMYRRGVIRHTRLMEPDALHLHSLMFRRIALPIERRMKPVNLLRANARVAPRLWLHSAACLVLALVFHDNTPALWLGLAAYALYYVDQYRRLARFERNWVRRWAVSVQENQRKVKEAEAS